MKVICPRCDRELLLDHDTDTNLFVRSLQNCPSLVLTCSLCNVDLFEIPLVDVPLLYSELSKFIETSEIGD